MVARPLARCSLQIRPYHKVLTTPDNVRGHGHGHQYGKGHYISSCGYSFLIILPPPALDLFDSHPVMLMVCGVLMVPWLCLRWWS